MDRLLLLAVVLTVLMAVATPAPTQTLPPGPLYDPNQLPASHGTLQVFSFTPRGDIEGFVLDDGTEVKTPPHLTGAMERAFKPGDKVTIHGLRAASLALIQALSVSNDATGTTVVDTGPPPPGRAFSSEPARGTSVTVAGTIRMLLHGPRGDVNGALLADGTILKLPPTEAERLSGLLVPGSQLTAKGIRHTLTAGSFVDLTAIGPANGPLHPIVGGPRTRLTLAAPLPA